MNIDLLRKSMTGQQFQQRMDFRLEKLQECESNPVARMQVMISCRDDFFYFMDVFGVAYEPRLAEMPDIPMFLWEYQKEAVSRIAQAETLGQDLFIEKTRDMGITWVCIWYILWRFIFADKWYCLLGSRKEEEVDNKGPHSLFGKLRYGYYALPTWMRPAKFRKGEHDLFKKLVNPDKMNFIEGESANVDFGRGRRASMIFADEMLFWRFARESWRSMTDTTPVRIVVSTPKPSSFARQLRESFEQQGKLLTLDWRMHPFKDEEWYKNEVARRSADPLSVDAELDIKYTADPTLAYYPEVQNCPVVDFSYDKGKPLYVGLDFGSRDFTAIAYIQRDTKNFYVIDGLLKKNKPLYWYYPFLKKGINFKTQAMYEMENKFTKERFILRGSDYTADEHELIQRFNEWAMPVMYCGESAHKMKMFKSNTSIQQELHGIGIPLRINDLAIQHAVRRSATKTMLATTQFSKTNGSLDIYDALMNSTYPIARDSSTNPETMDKPVHGDDGTADYRSAVENFAVNNVRMSTAGIRSFPYRRTR